ncbi:gem-associated protein 8-like [Genypterus blacodes]|uniref:gem-associated protein 8-like n=1 Tax=Genypterus blacodes TaxID=154954 RepID=UPI003F75F1CD
MEIDSVMSSFTNPVYMRYWQHYQQSMAWYQRHRRAYQKAWEAAYGPAYGPTYGPTCRPRQRTCSSRRDAHWHGGGSDSREEEDGGEESSEESQIECDVSNMEISDELRQYFAQTERHREELKKQMEAEQQDVYVTADQDLRSVSCRSSTAAPFERPGERRGAEMKKLYGEDAAKIQAMEAAMQLKFDRNCDLKQPKYWPVIPLKL